MLNVKIEDLKDFLEKSKSYIKVISFYVDKGGTGKSTHATETVHVILPTPLE